MTKCHFCEKPGPYGYRLPGQLSAIPKGKRGYLWVCREHRQDAESRRDKATGAKRPTPASGPNSAVSA